MFYKCNKVFFNFIIYYFLGDFVETLFNNNLKSMMPIFGQKMFDAAMTILMDLLGNFFDNVPGKYLYIEDLTPYLSNV